MIPAIRKHLLWEYDFANFNFNDGAAIVIERVVERGNMQDWKEMIQFYGKLTVLKYASASKQLSNKDKNFTTIIINSPLVN